jgi:glycosyltransferase involved in cell wall biosynthesis
LNRTEHLKETVVISAVNLTEAGPLSILKDATNNFVRHFLKDYKLVLLVNKKDLLKDIRISPQVEIREYAYPKKSWFLRIWFEYVHCWFISKKINPGIWIALHDMTPNVQCKKRVVYCHNPAPFYKPSFQELLIERSLLFFTLFYNWFYRINIHKNDYVVVQQHWMREEFRSRYKINNVIVSYPDVQQIGSDLVASGHNIKFSFFYPSLPRVFKNFELLLNAAEKLEKSGYDFEVILTFDGTENKYSSKLVKRYGHLACVRFIGEQDRKTIWQLYNQCSCLVFSSRMETWGLPITEMKFYNKPVLVADKHYAHETVGNYDKACFFDVTNATELASLMENAINDQLQYHTPDYKEPEQPFARSWKELFEMVLSRNEGDILKFQKESFSGAQG